MDRGLWWECLGVLIGACLISALTQAGLILLARRRSLALDRPDTARKQHGEPVSRLGGAGVIFGLGAGWLVGSWIIPGIRIPPEAWGGVVVCCSAMFLIGLVDDFHSLGAKRKLGLQVAAAVIAWLAGLRLESLFGIELGGMGPPLTVIWLIAVPNVINLIDGMDGLAGGASLLLAGFLAVVGFSLGSGVGLVLALGLAGGLLGFLPFNFPPAKIFLGDAGAYLAGSLMASVSLALSDGGSWTWLILGAGLALGLPILDAALAVARRVIGGFSVFRADSDHVHHRVLRVASSPRAALASLLGISLFFCLAGISTFWFGMPAFIAFLILSALLAWRGIWALGYLEDWRSRGK